MVVLDAAAEVAEFLANAAEEANWEDVAPNNDDESNIMNRHADVLSGFHVPELPPDAPHPREIVAASVRRPRLSKLREKWGAWKEVYDTVCASLAEKTAQDIPPSEWDVWEKTLWSIAKSYRYGDSAIEWLSLPGDRRVYKGANNPLVNEFFIDVSPAFLALAADIERAFETEEPPEDFDSILRRMQERFGFGDID